MNFPSERVHGVRSKLRRNRQIRYEMGSFRTDGVGNIIERPLTKGLECFGDPIERLFGRFDKPRSWGDREPEPRGCAMCPVSLYCGRVVHERLESSSTLRDRYYEWERETAGENADASFRHPTWTAFAVLCEQSEWTDINVARLQEVDAAKVAASLEKAAKRSAALRRRNKRTPRTVPKAMLFAIRKYRDERIREMEVAKQDEKPPLWLRNRSIDRCRLIAQCWEGREILERGGRKSSGRAVRDWLVDRGHLDDSGSGALTQRVNEALRRADQLMSQGNWPIFDPYGAPCGNLPRAGLHPDLVHTLLEE